MWLLFYNYVYNNTNEFICNIYNAKYKVFNVKLKSAQNSLFLKKYAVLLTLFYKKVNFCVFK